MRGLLCRRQPHELDRWKSEPSGRKYIRQLEASILLQTSSTFTWAPSSLFRHWSLGFGPCLVRNLISDLFTMGPHQEYKTPGNVAQEMCKPLHHSKVTTQRRDTELTLIQTKLHLAYLKLLLALMHTHCIILHVSMEQYTCRSILNWALVRTCNVTIYCTLLAQLVLYMHLQNMAAR